MFSASKVEMKTQMFQGYEIVSLPLLVTAELEKILKVSFNLPAKLQHWLHSGSVDLDYN